VTIRFSKWHGLGNDFVLVEGPPIGPERARRVCDRRRGIGADGVVSIQPPRTPGAAAAMHITNSDGSIAEMCGNAIRCVARHLGEGRGLEGAIRIDTDAGLKIAEMCGNAIRCVARQLGEGRGLEGAIRIDTDAGLKTCTLHRDPQGAVTSISVEMGPARLEGEQVFDLGGEALRATRVSMGNPHAVLFDAPTRERAGAVGPAIERAVPGGVNVGLARPARGGIDLVVWERGAGLTDACGTGACAAAVAAVQRGDVKAGEPVAVRLPGGTLEITVAPDLSRVVMRGPAEHVFEGEADL
jgi:diaminopimelate epimerase